MPCRSSQRLTGQLVAKPRIIPSCIKNQWLELSIGAFQITYCATAIQPNRPTSKLSTESVSDLIASPSGASRPDLAPQRCEREVLEHDPENPGKREGGDVWGGGAGGRADHPEGTPPRPPRVL